MEIVIYLHRTRKYRYAVCDKFAVDINFDKLPEDKREDIDFINQAFRNDCQRIARSRECVRKYGTGYISFIRPQYEGPAKDNKGTIYFSNKEMLFKKKKTRKKKVEGTDET